MNLTNLKVFVQVVDNGSISRVAEGGFVSQQAISDQIRRLEKYFGVSLLERGRPLHPTLAGKFVYDTAKEILSSFEQMEQRVKLLQKPNQELIVSTGLVWTPPFLPQVISRFRAVEPETTVKIIHPTTLHERQDEPLPGAELIVGNLPFADTVESIVIFEDRLSVAASREFLLSVFGSNWETRFKNLSEDDLRLLGLTEELEQRYQEADVGFLSQGESMDVKAFYCLSGQQAILVPERYAESLFEYESSVHITPLSGDNNLMRIGIGFRKGATLSSAAVRFIELANCSSFS